jgi:hypothetical protein
MDDDIIDIERKFTSLSVLHQSKAEKIDKTDTKTSTIAILSFEEILEALDQPTKSLVDTSQERVYKVFSILRTCICLRIFWIPRLSMLYNKLYSNDNTSEKKVNYLSGQKPQDFAGMVFMI